jgi:hypothetical protein
LPLSPKPGELAATAALAKATTATAVKDSLRSAGKYALTDLMIEILETDFLCIETS